ncbi:MFS transporter [Frankia sp. CNm7]|uniref:MFS transporter n=1 Tax=Frankia nepalensis TaxID=1836974 RepID=UPI0019313611|nr:MFS transporter [Frankia nepalensis]MBL7521988.1 MFS transporter [Frankia nepalensis]
MRGGETRHGTSTGEAMRRGAAKGAAVPAAGHAGGAGHAASSADSLVLMLAAAAFAVAQTAVVPGLGVLTKELRTTPANISWVLSAYLLSAAILTPMAGRLGDMFGKRRMLVIALVTFAAGSVLGALAVNVWMLVLARVVQGAGGGIIPLCFGLINDTFPAERRPGALGLMSAIAGIGAGGGLVMGGLLVDHASWQWIFWVGTAISAAAAFGAMRLPDSGMRAPGRIDVPGALLLAVGLTAPLLALTRTSAWGWLSARTLGLVGAGLVVLVLFGLFERRAAEPLVDLSVLARPAVLITNVVTALVGFCMFGAFVLIPQIAQTAESTGYGFGLSATGAGLLMFPACVAMLIAGSVSGRFTVRLGARALLAAGPFGAAGGLVGLALTRGSAAPVIALSIIVFTGVAVGMAAVPNIIIAAVPAGMTGQATGVNALVRSVGAALGSQVAATLLAASTDAATGLPTDGAFTQAFLLGAGGAVCAGLAGRLAPRRRRAGADARATPPEALTAVAPATASPHADDRAH